MKINQTQYPDRHHLRVEVEWKGIRLDQFFHNLFPTFSRSFLQNWIKQGGVHIDGLIPKVSLKLNGGEKLDYLPPKESIPVLNSERVPFPILCEKGTYLIIQKPPGLLAHPAKGSDRPSVAGALFNSFVIDDPEGMEDLRPGIVHRLDKDTSGLMIVALNARSREYFSGLFKDRKVEKIYRAIVYGKIQENEGVIEAPIGKKRGDKGLKWQVDPKGRESLTTFKVLKRGEHFTEIGVYPKTGRTHQIRVHLAFIGFPVVNDPLYGKKIYPLEVPGQLLCAESLKFTCPEALTSMEFTCPLDSRFEQFHTNYWT